MQCVGPPIPHRAEPSESLPVVRSRSSKSNGIGPFGWIPNPSPRIQTGMRTGALRPGVATNTRSFVWWTIGGATALPSCCCDTIRSVGIVVAMAPSSRCFRMRSTWQKCKRNASGGPCIRAPFGQPKGTRSQFNASAKNVHCDHKVRFLEPFVFEVYISCPMSTGNMFYYRMTAENHTCVKRQ